VVACPHRWLVTLDDVPEVRKIWTEAGVPEERMIGDTWKYSMTGKRDENKQGDELFMMDEETYAIGRRKIELLE